MNVFISIIEEAYVSSKTRDRNHWIYSYLKVDPQYVEISQNTKGIEKIQKINEKVNIQSKSHNQRDEYIDNNKQLKSQKSLKEIMNIDKKALDKDPAKADVTLSYEELSNKIKDKFTKIDGLIDDIQEIVDDVKKGKTGKDEDLKKLINENMETLNGKFRELTNFWAYEVSE